MCRHSCSVILVLLIIVVAVSVPRPARAFSAVDLVFAELLGTDIAAADIEVSVNFASDQGVGLRLSLASLSLPGLAQPLEQLEFICDLAPAAGVLECPAGSFSLRLPSGRRLTAALRLHYEASPKKLTLQFAKSAGWWDALDIVWQPWAGGNRFELSGEAVNLAVLHELFKAEQLADLTISAGWADLAVRIQSGEAGVRDVWLDAGLRDVSFANPMTTQAAEGLQVKLALQAHQHDAGWQGKLTTRVAAGYLYVDPVGVDAGTSPLAIDSTFSWQPSPRRLTLRDTHIVQQDVADVTIDTRLLLAEPIGIEVFTANITHLDLNPFYADMVQPWLYEYEIPELEWGGEIQGRVSLDENQALAVDLNLNDVSIEETSKLFGMTGIDGRLAWRSGESQSHSLLSWREAHFYDLPFGSATLDLQANGSQLSLANPLSVPFLDGSVNINSGSLSGFDNGQLAWQLDAYLTPVSMQELTEALGWQPFGGKLSGMIPDLSYKDQRLQLNGTLLVNAFDGDITVNHLSVENPFGLVPVLQADIDLRQLDLAELTGTFSFGNIEGRLDGYVHDLEMLAWQPVRFDAMFHTPEDDNSRHRISQKAVDNLARIGGGAGGALSRGFLGFLKTFPYDRLGLGCRLQNGVCQMHGVMPAGQGYYIVKGSWLPPRINIVGYADQVDWQQLVGQIISVTETGNVQIE